MDDGTIANAAPPAATPEVSQQAFSSGDEPRRYEFVDALRGVAVLGVIAVHTGQNSRVTMGAPLIDLGVHGVSLFYIVSAFSLCSSLAQRAKHEATPVRNYAVRRFFRVAPLFYLAMMVYLLAPGFLPAGAAPADVLALDWPLRSWHVLATALFVHGWHYQSINNVVPGGWSVAVESNFYLLLPLLLRYATSLRRALSLFGAALVVQVVARKACYLLFADSVTPQYRRGFDIFLGLWLPSTLPVFVLGIVMYHLLSKRGLGRASKTSREQLLRASKRHALVTFGVVAASVIALMFSPPVLERFVPVRALCMFCFCLVLAQRPARLLVNSLTILLGKISYSLYLFHLLTLHVLLAARQALGWSGQEHPLTNFWLFFPCVLAASSFLSYATYRFVELPGQALGRRVMRAWRTSTRDPKDIDPGPGLTPGGNPDAAIAA